MNLLLNFKLIVHGSDSIIRFSQFFVSPLVKAEAMDREILAVDSGM
jgi:secreted Zn-dependent insulinase-like peptidase